MTTTHKGWGDLDLAIEGVLYVCADLERANRFRADTLGWRLQTNEAAVADPVGYMWEFGRPS